MAFPIVEALTTELGSHRHMHSTATLSSSGNLDIDTTTWTDAHWSGFTGSVVVFLADASGNYLFHSQPQRYGVNGLKVPGASKRSDLHSETIPPAALSSVAGLAIWHGLTPKVEDNIDAALKIAKDVGTIISSI